MERIVAAMMREYQKLGRLRTEADFGSYLPTPTRRTTGSGRRPSEPTTVLPEGARP
jgi:hypothetical protein